MKKPREDANIPVCTKKVSEKAHRPIRKREQITKLSQKHYHNRKRRPGDHANVLHTQVSKSPNFKQFWRSPNQVKKKTSDVTHLVDYGRQCNDQVIHVDRMKRLRSQRIVGEADDAVIIEHAGHNVKGESGSDEPSGKEDKYDDPVNDFSDLPTIPCARSGQQRKKPAWHADYEM